MSLDIWLTEMQPTEIYSANITHNLGKMALKAGIYDCLWMTEEKGYHIAAQLIPELEQGINKMKKDPDYYRQFDSDNGWGTYNDFLP